MSKNKSVTELRDELKQLDARANAILDTIQKEGRMANQQEEKELGEIRSERFRLNCAIDDAEAMERRAGAPAGGARKETFSLAKAILNAATRSAQRDVEAEVFERAAKLHAGSGCNALSGSFALPMTEQRGLFTAAAESVTGAVIDENKQEMLFPLQSYLTFSKLGVRMLTGLKGDIVWPAFSDVTVNWEGENEAFADAGGAFSKGTKFSPIRIGAEAQISKQLLIQENIDVEAVLRRQIAMAIAQKLEATAFAEAAVAGAPKSLFEGATLVANGEMTWANIVELETKLATNNALVGNLGYVMHPALRGKAKTKVKDTSGAGGFVFDTLGAGDGYLNGYKAVTSTNVTSTLGSGNDQYGIIFGNWADYFLGQWGALDFIVDPYTAGNQSIVKLYITGYYNMGAIRPESFAVGALK